MGFRKIIMPSFKGLSMGLIALCFACGTNTFEVSTKNDYEVVHLPDGSRVYLNQNSAITYNQGFEPRIIGLKGEAFFEVKADESAFLVTTEFGDIKVLGTEFNVKTAEKQLEVDVKSGLVELKTQFDTSKVEKGLKAIYKEGDKAIQRIKSDKEFRKWIRLLKKEFKRLGKDIRPLLKSVDKDLKKASKELIKGLKKSEN